MTVFTNSIKPNPYVTLFPNNNGGAIVRLDGAFKISCLQAPRQVNVHIAYTPARLYKHKCIPCPYLEINELLNQEGDTSIRTCPGFFKMSVHEHSECKTKSADKLEVLKIDVPATMWVVSSNNEFKLYTVKTVGGVLYKYPYTLANVYSNGNICWGRSNKPPSDLQDAANMYWSLPFNSDLMIGDREDGDLSTKLSTFTIDNSDQAVLSHWQDCTDIFGRASLSRQKQVDGVSIWFDEETLALLPANKIYAVRRTLKDRTVLERGAVGWITYLKRSGNYLIDFDGFKIIKDKLTIKSKTTILGEIEL
jgi:hypothetical protein